MKTANKKKITNAARASLKRGDGKFLSKEEERALAQAWRNEGDIHARDKIILAHMPFARAIARKYSRTYHMPFEELEAEALVGLTLAARKFNPDLGYRFSTYAKYRIAAEFKTYISMNKKMVFVGTTPDRLKLLYNLGRVKNEIGLAINDNLLPHHIEAIATTLEVSHKDVVEIDRHISTRDFSLNAPIRSGNATTWMDRLESMPNDGIDPAYSLDCSAYHALLETALSELNPRERNILTQRRLVEEPVTQQYLGDQYGITKERIGQIEQQGFKRLRYRILELTSIDGPTPPSAKPKRGRSKSKELRS